MIRNQTCCNRILNRSQSVMVMERPGVSVLSYGMVVIKLKGF